MRVRRPATLWFTIFVLFLSSIATMLTGCGSGGSDSSAADSTGWATINSVTTVASQATVTGAAWISPSWSALHCIGFACLFDTSTNNNPGVTVTYTNQTTGVSGTATSFYGGGTGWVHQWRADVSLQPGVNVIVISAMDPGGKGCSVTQNVSM